MTPEFNISSVQFHEAPTNVRSTGLLGWVDLTVNEHFRVMGLALRRTADGTLTLAYPRRLDGQGRKRTIIRPLDDDTRRRIEAEVFRHLDNATETGKLNVSLNDVSDHSRRASESDA